MLRLPDAAGEAVAPDWRRSALLTIDMQNDFAAAAGAGFVPGTDGIVAPLACLVDSFRRSGRPVFHAVRLYAADGSNAERCRRDMLRGGHALVRPGSWGAQLVDALAPPLDGEQSATLSAGRFVRLGPDEWLFYKSRWSAFFRTALTARLTTLGVDTLVVAGCNLPNCPSATMFDATSRDLRVVLAVDAVSQLSPAGLAWCSGVGVVRHTVAEISAALQVD